MKSRSLYLQHMKTIKSHPAAFGFGISTAFLVGAVISFFLPGRKRYSW